MDQALQEIGSDLPEAPAPHKPVDYDFSAPYSPLEGVTAPALTRPRWGPVVQPDMAHPHIPTGPPESTLGMGCVVSGTLALPSPLPGSAYSHSSDSTMGVGCVVSGAEVLPRPSPHGQASQSSIPLGQYSSDVPLALHTANVHGHPSQTTVQLVDGSQAKQMDSRQENTEDPSPPGGMVKEAEGTVEASCLVEMKPAEIEKLDHVGAEEQLAGSLREASASSTPEQGHDSGYHPGQASPSLSGPSSVSELPTANIQGHASDAHIKVGEHVSDVEAPLPSQNIHGHSSDANIKVGEFVSEMTAPLPTANVHGHASDAHIKVGEHVSEVVASLFTQNIHGHASDSHIKVGEHMSEEVASIHTQNIHGHSSDTHFKAGEFVLDAEPSRPRWSKHGHASDCTLQVGCVMSGTEPVLSPLPGSTYGHSSESTLGIGCVVSGVEPLHAPLPGSDFGHASDSTLGGGCVVSGTATLPSPIPGSDYGHSSDSAMGGGCVISGIEPVRAPLPGSNFGQSSDSTLGTGCVVSGVNPLPSPIPGSTYGHSSDSALGGGCKVKETGNEYDARTLEQQEQQRLAEGISSWAAGLALSPGESSEREYLSSLAAQYQVEQYEDCYGLMSESRQTHTGLHVQTLYNAVEGTSHTLCLHSAHIHDSPKSLRHTVAGIGCSSLK